MSVGTPNWIDALADECARSSQAAAARRVGYSATTINQVLKGTYKGDLSRVETAVKGALLAETVTCPVLGEITADKCLAYQRQPFAATNPERVRLWRACRGACPNSRIGTSR